MVKVEERGNGLLVDIGHEMQGELTLTREEAHIVYVKLQEIFTPKKLFAVRRERDEAYKNLRRAQEALDRIEACRY